MPNPYTEPFEGNSPLVKRNGFFIPHKIEEVSNEEHALAIYRCKAIQWIRSLYVPLSISSVEFYSIADSPDYLSMRLYYVGKIPVRMRDMKDSRILHRPYGEGDTDRPFTEISAKEHETDDSALVFVCHLLMNYIEKRGKKIEVKEWMEYIQG